MSGDIPILPDIIIAGAPKCGTTSLFSYLADHPAIQGSTVKETHILLPNSATLWPNIATGIEGYRYFFPSSQNKKLKMEATPTYLYFESVRKIIKSMKNKPKVIFLLREPGSQIFSFFKFLQSIQHGTKDNRFGIPFNLTFFDFINSLRKGTHNFKDYLIANTLKHAAYVDCLNLWKKDLDPNQIKIYLFEDLCQNNQKFMRRVCDDLNIDSSFYNDYEFKKENETFEVRNRALFYLKEKVSTLLPKNNTHSFLRNIYIKINNKKLKKTKSELSLIKSLGAEYQQKNLELAHEFNLNISSWKL